jgi:TPR repeat protein
MAALMLGRYLAAGIACARDPAAARAFFAQALEAGIAEAQAELDALEQAERDALALAELNAVEVEAPPAEAAE